MKINQVSWCSILKICEVSWKPKSLYLENTFLRLERVSWYTTYASWKVHDNTSWKNLKASWKVLFFSRHPSRHPSRRFHQDAIDGVLKYCFVSWRTVLIYILSVLKCILIIFNVSWFVLKNLDVTSWQRPKRLDMTSWYRPKRLEMTSW